MTRERKLLNKIKNGDDESWNELIELYYPEIYRYCLWHTPDICSAEDATQETFLKTVKYFDHYVNYGKFKAFLYKIAANTCKDIWKKKNLQDISLEEVKQEFLYLENGYQLVESCFIW